MFFAHRARTTLVLGAACAATVTALLLSVPTQRLVPACNATCTPSAGGIVTARLASTNILAGEQGVAVTIQMPRVTSSVRPPLSLAVVIDRSGSMEGEPLANAKTAAAQLVDQLGESDAFSIVTYSSGDETVMPMVRATADNKAAAREAIAGIWDDGNTCISCGIERGATELARTPVHGGVRRMVLISDGQANAGRYDRNDLAQLAIETAASGVSISTVGVGLEFDEITMMKLADVGHGNYYFVEDTQALGAMFAQELGGLGTTIGTDARLVIQANPGVLVEDVVGYHVMRQGPQLVVPLADLRAGETRKVVLRTTVTAGSGALDLAQVSLHWRQVEGGMQTTASTIARAVVTTDPAAVTATIDREALTAIEQARTARVLEEATTIYERDGYEAAQRVLERQKEILRANANLLAEEAEAMQSASDEAIVNFSKAPPAKAKKAARAQAYELAR